MKRTITRDCPNCAPKVDFDVIEYIETGAVYACRNCGLRHVAKSRSRSVGGPKQTLVLERIRELMPRWKIEKSEDEVWAQLGKVFLVCSPFAQWDYTTIMVTIGASGGIKVVVSTVGQERTEATGRKAWILLEVYGQ